MMRRCVMLLIEERVNLSGTNILVSYLERAET